MPYCAVDNHEIDGIRYWIFDGHSFEVYCAQHAKEYKLNPPRVECHWYAKCQDGPRYVVVATLGHTDMDHHEMVVTLCAEHRDHLVAQERRYGREVIFYLIPEELSKFSPS